MSIIDTPFNTQSSISCLKSKGVTTIMRYYNFSNSLSFPNKRLELPEAEALAADGFQIGVVFQQRQNQAADFTNLKGFAAGRQAFRHAQHNIGQPAGSGIYFSVDFDASNSEIKNSVVPFFQGVQQALNEESGGTSDYRIGVYGSGLTSSVLTDKGLIELTWLAMSRGFRGTKQALEAGEFNLAQVAPEAILCGLGVDLNDPNPNRPDFGTFTLVADATAAPVTPVSTKDLRKVTARDGLRLREGPGTQFQVIGGLPFGKVVTVVSITDGFAHIDVEGDGKLDGFASVAFLEPA